MVDDRISLRIFFGFVIGSLLSTAVASSELLYPVDSQALWFRAFVLLALPFYVHLLVVDRNLRPSLKNPLTLAVAGFLLVSLLGGVFGANPKRSFWGDYVRMGGEYHLIHLTLLYFYLLLLAKASSRYLTALLRLLVSIAALSSIYAVLIALGMRSIVWNPLSPSRIASIYGNPIFFASFLVLPMALTLFSWSQSKTGSGRYLCVAMFALQLTGVVLSGTRGAIVGLVAGCFVAGVLFVLRRQTSSHRYAAIGLMALACISVFLIIAARWFPNTVLTERFAQLDNRGAKARLAQLRIGWQGFQERPLLGTGVENYYVVFQKYQPLYLYESGVFDKPHNYPLELLVTTGLTGFLAYLAMFVLTVIAFRRAYQAGRISWVEFVILATGAVIYQIQNLFAFDTPSAGVAFYVYTGFAGILWTQCRPQSRDRENSGSVQSTLRGRMVFWVAAPACFFTVFVTEGITAATIRNINYGRVMQSTNVHAAKAYFDNAAHSAFIYDRGELGMRYQEFVQQLAIDGKDQGDAVFVKSALDAATAVSEQNTKEISNDPLQWLRLAEVYFSRARFDKTSLNPRADTAILNAIALAPNRIEPFLSLAQNDELGHHLDEAAAISRRMLLVDPKSPEAHWILASVCKLQHKQDLAVHTADEALRLGYHARSVKELTWLIDYYASKHVDRRVAELYELAVEIDPTDSQLFASLASVYGELGDKKKAKVAANQWLIGYYADKHDYRKLAELYEGAVRLTPDDFQLYASLAAVYANLGEKEKARFAAERTLQLNPSLELQTKAFLRSLQ